MTVLEHSILNFRNITQLTLAPQEGINLIHGQNGQGKTNILESIWLFTGCHSFRTKKNAELIREGTEGSSARLRFFAAGREQKAAMRIHQTREVELNGIQKKSPRQLLGEIQAVIFSPEALSIVKEGPAQRRRFLDVAISQIQPNYAKELAQYARALQQRNSLLRWIASDRAQQQQLEPWDEALVRHGTEIITYRRRYIALLSERCGEIYEGISGGKETLTLSYESAAMQEGGDTAQQLRKLVAESKTVDLRRQHTTQGIHKEDIVLSVNGQSARSYASQGQQRSCALALKIGEAQLLLEKTGEKPIVLLDDVMSELDEQRQQDVLRYLEQWQVFVTCCEPSRLLRMKIGKAFAIKEGKIVNE